MLASQWERYLKLDEYRVTVWEAKYYLNLKSKEREEYLESRPALRSGVTGELLKEIDAALEKTERQAKRTS